MNTLITEKKSGQFPLWKHFAIRAENMWTVKNQFSFIVK